MENQGHSASENKNSMDPVEGVTSQLSEGLTLAGVPPKAETTISARQKLEEIKVKTGWKEHDRGDLDKEGIKWRHGKPDFSVANLSYYIGRSRNHKDGSLEQFVEGVVKKWEMEGSHKVDFQQWETVNQEHYRTSANRGKVYKGVESAAAGNYQWLLDGCAKDLYDVEKEDFDTSHDLFRSAFPDGFAWELLELFSGPPKLVFTWRHWATFSGHYHGRQGNSELMEMFGFCQVDVDENLKICNIEVYYKPDEFLKLMDGTLKPEEISIDHAFTKNASMSAAVCPFIQHSSG